MEANGDEPSSAAVRRRAPAQEHGKSTSAFIFGVVKKLSIVSAIYCAGYMNWSLAWLITPIILGETREYLSATSNVIRRKIAKESARGNEKGAILACVRDLPSWVRFDVYHITHTKPTIILPNSIYLITSNHYPSAGLFSGL